MAITYNPYTGKKMKSGESFTDRNTGNVYTSGSSGTISNINNKVSSTMNSLYGGSNSTVDTLGTQYVRNSSYSPTPTIRSTTPSYDTTGTQYIRNPSYSPSPIAPTTSGGGSSSGGGGTAVFGGRYVYNVDSSGNPYGSPISTISDTTTTSGGANTVTTADGLEVADYGDVYTPREMTEYDTALNAREKELYGAAYGEVPTEEELYRERLKMNQAEIDAINAIYADLLNQARAKGIGREESLKYSQGRAGLVGSPIQGAQMTELQKMNLDEQKALANEQALKIQSIMGEAKKYAVDEARARREAKSKAAGDYISFLQEGQTRKTSGLKAIAANLVAQGIDITKLSESDMAEILKDYKANKEEFTSVYNEAVKESEKATAESEKATAELEYKQAQTEKLKSEIENWGKMTDYQKQQIAVDWYKAKNPSSSVSDEEVDNLIGFSDVLEESLDENRKLTPAQYNGLKSQYIAAGIGDSKDFDLNYKQHVYINKKDREYSYSYEDYNLKEEE